MVDDPARLGRLEATAEGVRTALAALEPLAPTLARVQTDQAHHRSSLGRAFARLDDLDRRLARLESETAQAQARLEDGVAALHGRLRVQAALVAGALAGGGAVLTALGIALRADGGAVLRALGVAG
ncbi:hypothetical protein [Pararhodospirillum photometricum]|nr:hypothetical protein [Pararhodospirillum photometricum]